MDIKIEEIKTWGMYYFIEEQEYEIVYVLPNKYINDFINNNNLIININEIISLEINNYTVEIVTYDSENIRIKLNINQNNFLINYINIEKIILLSNDNNFDNIDNKLINFMNNNPYYVVLNDRNWISFFINGLEINNFNATTKKSIDYLLSTFNIEDLDNPLNSKCRYFILDDINNINNVDIHEKIFLEKHLKTIDLIIFKNRNEFNSTRNRITLHIKDALISSEQKIYEIKRWL